MRFRRPSPFARFLAGLLTTAQLVWGLPMAQALETLRTGQEAQTHAAGLKQAVTAGMEEDEKTLQVRETLRASVFGPMADRLLTGDLVSLRTARQQLDGTLDLYARALGVTLLPLQRKELVQKLSRWTFQPLPAPTIQAAMDNVMRAQSWHQFMEEAIPWLESATEQFIGNPSIERMARKPLHRFLGSEHIEEDQQKILHRVAQWIAGAFLEGTSPDEIAREVQEMTQKTYPSSFRGLIRFISTGAHMDFAQNPARFKDLFGKLYLVTAEQGAFAGFHPKHGIHVVIPSQRTGLGAPQLGAVAAHEYAHVELIRRGGPAWQQRPETGTGMVPADWITEAAGLIVGEQLDQEMQGLQRSDERWHEGSDRHGPTILAWAFQEGQRIARLPSRQWRSEIEAIPVDAQDRYYLQGAVVGGIAWSIGREITTGSSSEDLVHQALLILARYAKEANAPTLEELARLARVFRQEHGLPPEASAGLEETILLIGSDPEGRIEGIIRNVFPASDVQPMKLPLPSKIQFREIDIAVLTKFDEAVKETLASAFRTGTISHVIAPDHFEDELDDYPLREALEGFRDTLAGMEEVRQEGISLNRWMAEHRPAIPPPMRVILGASVAWSLPLQVLAGMEDRIFVDRGDRDRLIVELMSKNAQSALFYGGLEEFRALEPLAKFAGIRLGHRSTEEARTRLELGELVTQILTDLGYSSEAVSAGMEEIVRRLEAVAEAA